jgi:hypothetical protein
MSYYILPKNFNNIAIDIATQETEPSICVSHSIYYYYNDTMKLIEKLCENSPDTSYNSISELIKIVNPYEYIFSKVSGSKYSVSKIKPNSSIFYDFLEIINTLNLFDNYTEHSILSTHFGVNNKTSIECMNMLRDDNSDVNIGCESMDEFILTEPSNSCHFLFFECDTTKNMSFELIKCLIIILKSQKRHGSCVIKLSNLFYKPFIDALYILTSLYEKTYIIKPNTTNITSSEKYLVCKYHINDAEKKNNYLKNLNEFYMKNKNGEQFFVSQLINESIPYYFINKIEEANIIIGQQQLESLDQIVTILKNKNKEDKIDNIQKNNLQKCIYWCEKYKIPCNKFTEKVNIFLSFIKSNRNANMYGFKHDDDLEHDNIFITD